MGEQAVAAAPALALTQAQGWSQSCKSCLSPASPPSPIQLVLKSQMIKMYSWVNEFTRYLYGR